MRVVFRALSVVVVVAGCAEDSAEDIPQGEAQALLTTSVVPPDGECVHVTATRLSDFEVSEYRGPLAGGSLRVNAGENRVTAMAYPMPCSNEPAEPPWIADDQLVTFSGGSNTLVLRFRRSSETTIDPIFDDETVAPLVQPGSRMRTGGAFEDAAGPSFGLDGFDLRGFVLPPFAPQSTFICRFAGLPEQPRGLASTSSRFVVQLSGIDRPLYVYDSSNCAPAGTWPVDYVPGQTVWSNTDGIEAIDDTHFVRTGWAATPQGCASATGCFQAGIEILELVSAPSGERLVVRQQLPLPPPHHLTYPLAVMPIGNTFAVTTVTTTTSELFRIDGAGNLLPGGSTINSVIEGLFDSTNRIAALDSRGHVGLYSASDASPLGVTADFRQGADFLLPTVMTWLPAPRYQLLMISGQERQWMTVPADFSAPQYFAADYDNPSGLDYKPDTDQILVTNRIPPIDVATNTRIPTVDLRDASSRALVTSLVLRDVPLPVRSQTLAYIPQGALIATHYARPGAVPDATLDPVVYLHDFTGALVSTFSLQAYGFVDIGSIDYLPASNELLIRATDFTGTQRLVVTTTAGKPKRSYRTDELEHPIDFAPMTDGPFAGDIGALETASSYVRIRLPD